MAYSLREAERRHQKVGSSATEVLELGGITRIAGMVYEQRTRDLIVVGQINEGEARITLDDLVVALRALFVHQAWPLVSIDKTPETPQTGRQTVRFEGGIANTAFGKALLEADIALKQLALGLLPTEIWGLQSYFALSTAYAREQGKDEHVCSRFWYYPLNPSIAVRDGVFALGELLVGVRTQVMCVNGQSITGLTAARDPLGDTFAESLTAHYRDLSIAYPAIGRLQVLFDLVALARGIQLLPSAPDLSYWLQTYPVARVETPQTHPLLKQQAKLPASDHTKMLEIDGGVQLKALVLRLQDGDITALRDAVLLSRPQGQVLTWRVPLEGWRLPGTPETHSSQSLPILSERIGTSVTRHLSTPGIAARDARPPTLPLTSPSFPTSVPHFEPIKRLASQTSTGKIGGVMLHNVATIAGAEAARVDLSKSHFALIVEGQSARLEPAVFRQFITALWAVYYCAEDPGVSIDPIAPKAQKHLVRYIGCKVINSDLGRVMRQADYLMKKWAVGTERPKVPGFTDVDDLMAKFGFRYVGASRRFWFVPETMRFKRSDDMLLFESGRMTVKTEYVVQDKGVKAERADEAFAQFFTDRYLAIAAKYPIYKELFEYAKLVALAKYLKEQEIPLSWFLLAYKDLVLTEDSPGTVDALAKGSKHFEGISIQGGVDLKVQGHYVYDQQAAQALRAAMTKRPVSAYVPTALPADQQARAAHPERFAFEVEKRRYVVVPQHSLTSGTDRRGLRYQTDLALRSNGQPGLEIVRYYRPGRDDAGEFGRGWHLLVPYRVQPVGTATRQFLNAVIPQQMAVVNLLTGEEEVLAFSTDRYSIAGYVPEKLAASQVIGLFIMSDASYRLADKLGNAFWFDQTGVLTDMIFGPEHHVLYTYLTTMTEAFEQPPYRLQPVDDERMPFRNARIPRRMQVTDLVNGTSEVLVFSDQGKIAGYIPETRESSRFHFLAILSNGAFRLLDRADNESAFTPSGTFAGMLVAPERRMIASIAHGKQHATFTYTIDRSGQVRIARAQLHEAQEERAATTIVRYQYDDTGRLARVHREANRVAALQQGTQSR
jgi:hypothetical protein